MSKTETHKLTDIDLTEISGVDIPANQFASVVLVKRVAPESLSGYTDGVKPEIEGKTVKGDGSVTVEELTKKLEGLQTQVADLTKRAEDAENAAETLVKSAEDAGLDIEDGKIAKRADPEYVEIDGEKVEKSAVNPVMLRAIEKQAAEIADMRKRAEEVDLAKRGETELPNLAGTALTKGRLLKAVEGDADLLAALKAADAAMKSNYEEKGDGNTDGEMAEPAKKLDRMARDYAAEKGMPFETAYAEITKSGDGADLLRAMRSTAN